VGRADGGEFAGRVNAAVELMASGVTVAEAARVLAARFGVSVRQGRRYADRAVVGRVVVPEATVVFTVKVPVSVAQQVRSHASQSGVTISSVVAAALADHLRRGRR
jgi:uncharacterized protein with PIN domain